VRDNSGRAAPELIDELLLESDALEREVALAVATIPPQLDDGSGDDGAGTAGATLPQAVAGARAPGRDAVSVPAGTVQVLTVQLRADAAIKSARALLVLRAVQAQTAVLGSQPAPLPPEFDGTLHVFLDGTADPEVARAAALDAGEVADATLWRPDEGAGAERPPAARATNGARSGRQVRVEERRLDGLAEGIGELSVLRNRLRHAGAPGGAAAAMIDRMGGLLGELQAAVLAMRMVPLSEAFERLPRVVRDAARSTGKDVELEVRGETIELDRAILHEIGEPLVHLLRNAVDHGIETPAARARAGKPERGRIVLEAERERSSVRIVLEDDGAGVDRVRVVAKGRAAGLLPPDGPAELADEELFRVLSSPGFSTAEQVSEVSGRGVGLDTVVSRIRALGGAVDMHSETGTGTRFSLRLPITLALVRALRVRVGGEDYAIPLTHITEALELGETEDEVGRERVRVRDDSLPLVRLRQVLQVPGPERERAAVVAELGERRAALAVDELVGHEQILVKGFDAAPGTLPVFSGATLLDDGRPALVLDPLSVM
jgi:two-component system chemotaxis sensor kinase CheA